MIKLLKMNLLFVSAGYAQESFSASGGLETLTLSLLRLAPAADMNLLSCQLSVTISKTLSACVTYNCVYFSLTQTHA